MVKDNEKSIDIIGDNNISTFVWKNDSNTLISVAQNGILYIYDVKK